MFFGTDMFFFLQSVVFFFFLNKKQNQNQNRRHRRRLSLPLLMYVSLPSFFLRHREALGGAASGGRAPGLVPALVADDDQLHEQRLLPLLALADGRGEQVVPAALLAVGGAREHVVPHVGLAVLLEGRDVHERGGGDRVGPEPALGPRLAGKALLAEERRQLPEELVGVDRGHARGAGLPGHHEDLVARVAAVVEGRDGAREGALAQRLRPLGRQRHPEPVALVLDEGGVDGAGAEDAGGVAVGCEGRRRGGEGGEEGGGRRGGAGGAGEEEGAATGLGGGGGSGGGSGDRGNSGGGLWKC